LICADEKKHLADIERFLKKKIKVVEVGDFKRGDSLTLKEKTPVNDSRLNDGDKRGSKDRRLGGGKRSSADERSSRSAAGKGKKPSKPKKAQKKYKRR